MFKRPLAIVFALAVTVVALSGAERAEADHWLPIFDDTVVCSVQIDDITLVAPVELQDDLEALAGRPASTTPFHQVVECSEGTAEIHFVGSQPECGAQLILWLWGFTEAGGYPSPIGEALVYSR